MSDTPKERKYQFDSKVRLPNMQEIIDAASDFTPPTDKKFDSEKESAVTGGKKLDIKELTKQASMSPEQAELQKLGDAVANAEIQRAKEKERLRAEELRRLCKEREEEAQKKAQEERKVAEEERRKAIEAAREKANARKEAEAAAAARELAEQDARDTHSSMELDLDDIVAAHESKMPPVKTASSESAPASDTEKPADEASPVSDFPASSMSAPEERREDLSAVADNPFEDKPKETKPKEKEEFKETVLEDDYMDEMDLREDSSESVDDDFLDF